MEHLFNTSNLDLVAKFSQHPSVSTCYGVWIAYPSPYPKSPAQRLACSSPTGSSPDILVTCPFWTFDLLAAAPVSPLSLFPSPSPCPLPKWPSKAWLYPLWIVPDVPASSYTPPLIYNKLSPSPYLGAVVAFLFYFFFSFKCLMLILTTEGRD